MTEDRAESTLAALQPFIERARGFSGWNFDGLDVRDLEPPPPWDYVAIARNYAERARRVLDIGTGGGEVLSSVIVQARPGIVATERWHVNAPIARARLRSIGADVVRARSSTLPFRDASFDLVVDRHAGTDADEVIRVLGGHGAFVTQQVWRKQWIEAKRFFPDKTDWGDHLNTYRRAFESAGYSVQVHEHDWKVAYGSLGDFVFMMLVTPWEWPSFDPARDIEALIALEDALRTSQGIVLTLSRYLLIADSLKRA